MLLAIARGTAERRAAYTWISQVLIRGSQMIQRLIDSLQALAAPTEAQSAWFADGVVKVDELVLDFDDAFLLIRDCQQLMLTGRQLDALVDLDRTLTALSRAAGSQPWTADALHQHPEWQVVRRQAAAALAVLLQA